MKKLFFTAIALVAFSGISMGNTIEDNDISSEAISPNPWLDWGRSLIECGGAYQEMIAAYTPVFGEKKAQEIATGAWLGCMGVL